MTGKLVTFLLWFCAIGSGLIAGVFFAFSTFIMRALARIEQSQGISAMQAINTTILGSLFMPVFFGTTFASLVLAGVVLWGWGESGSLATFAASLIYVIGMFIVTVAFNVPLNNALAKVEASAAGATSLWARYLVEWTRWNHVRTVSSTIACVLFVYAIALRWTVEH